MKSYGEEREVKWDTKCRLKMFGRKDVESIIQNKRYEIDNARSCIRSVEDEIKTLQGIRFFKDKPPLPNNRGAEYFKIGSVVYVFHDHAWHRGVVVSGYRTDDGCVSYVLDDYPDSKKGWGCGGSVPCVIMEWEFNYFKKNPRDFKEWCRLSDRIYNGERLDLDDYFTALTQN